jgi:hypothetical protein
MTSIGCPDAGGGFIFFSPCTHESALGTLVDTAGFHGAGCDLQHSPARFECNMQRSAFTASSGTASGTITYQLQAVEQNTGALSNVATVTINVEPISADPLAVLEDLQRLIEREAVQGGSIHPTLSKPMLAHVEGVDWSLRIKINLEMALRRLEAFAHEVSAHIGKKIAAVTGTTLIQMIDRVRESVGSVQVAASGESASSITGSIRPGDAGGDGAEKGSSDAGGTEVEVQP